ncbi:hypothetical protein SALB1_3610 [Salinisphaera sp. LB1]|nr:hypothetical protein SALB1_3610 [Salinisphaera sp. LB1]
MPAHAWSCGLSVSGRNCAFGGGRARSLPRVLRSSTELYRARRAKPNGATRARCRFARQRAGGPR